MEWVAVGVIFIVFLSVRRHSRKSKVNETAPPLTVFRALIRIWVALGFDSNFTRRSIQDFRSEGMALDEILASFHTAGFDSFCELFSKAARDRGLTQFWEGNERRIYDSAIQDFLRGKFGEEVARATMERVQGPLLAAEESPGAEKSLGAEESLGAEQAYLELERLRANGYLTDAAFIELSASVANDEIVFLTKSQHPLGVAMEDVEVMHEEVLSELQAVQNLRFQHYLRVERQLTRPYSEMSELEAMRLFYDSTSNGVDFKVFLGKLEKLASERGMLRFFTGEERYLYDLTFWNELVELRGEEFANSVVIPEERPF